jgi:hypothetical protein
VVVEVEVLETGVLVGGDTDVSFTLVEELFSQQYLKQSLFLEA